MDNDAKEQAEVLAMLAEHLQAAALPKAMLDNVEKRLENRIQTSIANHAGLRTVRSRDGLWKNLTKGIRFKPLWQSALYGNSVLIEFAAGASLPLHRHNYLEEGVVLSGSLRADDVVLRQFDYHMSPEGSHHGRIWSDEGGLAYLRGSSIGQTMAMVKEMVGGLLPKNNDDSLSIRADDSGWVELQPGLFQKILWTDGKIASQFYRLQPDTTLDGHDHTLDEECMMLDGDIFLGDILLQAGDYHLAPKDTSHLDIYTDTGALLYVRGAVQERGYKRTDLA